MDGQQEVANFVLVDHFVVLIDCFFRHFTHVKNFELASDYTDRWMKYMDFWDFYVCFKNDYLQNSVFNTVHAFYYFNRGVFLELDEGITKLVITRLRDPQTVKIISTLPNLKTLYLHDSDY